MFEPFLCWVTDARVKGLIQRYASWFYGPVVYASLYVEQLVKRVVTTLEAGKNQFYTADVIPFVLPVAMYCLGGKECELWTVLKMWLVMVFGGSLYFGFVGLNAGHHNHHVVHDGDILRYKNFDFFFMINFRISQLL